MHLLHSWTPRGALAVLALCGLMAGEANARVFVRFGLGFPIFAPPLFIPGPYYYPPYYGPPTVYAPPAASSFNYVPPSAGPQSLSPPRPYAPSDSYGPPPGSYMPPGSYTPSMGPGSAAAQSCQAGAYVCPLVETTPPGGACSCPGHNGQRIRGQAN